MRYDLNIKFIMEYSIVRNNEFLQFESLNTLNFFMLK